MTTSQPDGRDGDIVAAPQTSDTGETLATSLPIVMPTDEARAQAPAAPSAPHNLAAYWDAIDRELARFPAAPEVEHLLLHSTDFATCYRVRVTSIGHYRISAYLTIPVGDGPFPALFLVPGYGSVVTPPSYEDRQRYVCLSVMHRGARHADHPYAGKFPGLLTDGIEVAGSWVFRAILADLIRAFEYLLSRPEVSPDKVAIQGSDVGLLIAARRPGARAIAVGGGFFHQLAETYATTDAYPIEEINDHLRAHPDYRDGVDATLAMFDPVHQAGRITATTNFAVSDPAAVAELITALSGEVNHYIVTHEGQTDRDAIDVWIAGQLGAVPKPRIWKPESIGAWS